MAFFFIFCFTPQAHPTSIPAQPHTLAIPNVGESIASFAHRHADAHNQPVFILYKARSGQLNNQLISFFNALTIAKLANATLIAPFAFYGSESFIDFANNRNIFFYIKKFMQQYAYEPILKQLGLFLERDQLVGDYFDSDVLNRTQPVISIMDFLKSPAAEYLRSFPHVLVRNGDAGFFHMTLGRRTLFKQNVHIRSKAMMQDPMFGMENIASRRELDCNFNVSNHFRGLQYRAGVNGNFLFLSKLYRSHSLNCTATNPYWLDVRRFVQPRMEIRQLVDDALFAWGKLLTLHLRLFPYDHGKFTLDTYCNFFLNAYHTQITEADHIYIAYSASSEMSVAIVKQLRIAIGPEKVKTAQDFGNLYERGPVFDKGYIVTLVDMWTCVRSHVFIGRLGSSLSWNVVYWREALQEVEMAQNFYKLQDFSVYGEKNPTDTQEF